MLRGLCLYVVFVLYVREGAEICGLLGAKDNVFNHYEKSVFRILFSYEAEIVSHLANSISLVMVSIRMMKN